MSRTRTTVNLIDADACTFNKDYRRRLLYCINQYGVVIEEFGTKVELTPGEALLLNVFIDKVVSEQKAFFLKDAEYQQLLAHSMEQARLFDNKNNQPQDDKPTDSLLLGSYIYYFICHMENACPAILRAIFICANQKLIKKIEKQIEDSDQVINMLGSNRQSRPSDELNMIQKGTTSIFTELHSFTKHVNEQIPDARVKLEKITLPDFYEENVHCGNNFKKILRGESPSVRNAFDNSKVNIVYPFSHYIAKKQFNSDIVINMWDDLDRILKSVKKFFTKHPDLLPNNVQLNLCRYTGRVESIKTLSGTGIVDQNYKENTVLMGNLCGFDAGNNLTEVNIAENLDVKSFVQKRTTGWECVPYESDATFFKHKKSAKQDQKQDQEIKSVTTLALV